MKAVYRVGIILAAILAPIGGASAAETTVPLPDVSVTAPSSQPTVPPYLRDPWKSPLRNPMHGRWRNEEDKFVEQPCGSTRISSAAAGARCLVGYRLTPAAVNCDMGLDVVAYRSGNLDVEADILSFDPYKVTATGAIPKGCRITPYKDYAEEDFQDMNQVTRRGSNFHNLVQAQDADFSIEFFDSNRPCIAVRRPGPDWHGGKIWVMHVTICRADAKPLSPQDVAFTTSALQIRVYDPVGNLVAAPK